MRFKIDWASLYLEANYPFLLCFTLYLREIFQVQVPVGGGGGGLYSEGRFHGGFFVLRVLGGLYLEGLIFGILRQFQHGIQIWPHTSSFKCALTRILNEILVNFLVSASNELGKVWEETEEENLVPAVVKGTGEDSGKGSVKFEEGFPPIHASLPLPPLSNDRFRPLLFIRS